MWWRGLAQAVFGSSAGWTLAPMFVGLAALGLSALLGAGSFLASMQNRRPDRQARGRRVLVAAAPVLVFLGMELLPHAISPCSISAMLDRLTIPSFCERTSHGSGFGGKGEVIEDVDINERWHTLSHALIGAIPMAALYALALRRWRPEILRGVPAR